MVLGYSDASSVRVIGPNGEAAITRFDLINCVDPSRSRQSALQRMLHRVAACDRARDVTPVTVVIDDIHDTAADDVDAASAREAAREWFKAEWMKADGNVVKDSIVARGVDFASGPDTTATVTVQMQPDGSMVVTNVSKTP